MEKLDLLFLKAKKSVLSIAMVVLTLIIGLSILGSQNKKVESLRAAKGAELKKNEVLQGISRLDKTMKLYKGLLGKKDAYSVMNTIGNIVRDSDLRLISLKPDTEIDQPLYIKYPFNLNVGTDNYHAIGKFVSNIENYPDIFFIDAITIKAQEEKQTQEKESAKASMPAEKLNVNLTLSIIVFRN